MKRILPLLFLFFMGISMLAQQIRITGRVVSALTSESLSYVRVDLLRADSTVLKRGKTDENGRFSFETQLLKRYLVRVELLGLKTRYLEVKPDARQQEYRLGEIPMSVDATLLDEVVVKHSPRRVEIKGDTTIFNAGAYKVPEGARLEALVKLLPGVKLDGDGNITWNGKLITSLLLNGEDFFKGDQKLVLKNLPVDLIAKIKAYEKKSDYTEQTGIEDGEKKAVLDITTKKKLERSLISNIALGYGTKDRTENRLFVSRFSDRSNISAFGNVDNTTMGGMGKTYSPGINFYWNNGKKRREKGRVELLGSALFNKNSFDQQSVLSSETFLTGNSNSSFSQSYSKNTNVSQAFSANFSLKWEPDSMTYLSFHPNFSHNWGNSQGESRMANFKENPELLAGGGSPLDSIFSPNPGTAWENIGVNRNVHASLGNSIGNTFNARMTLLRRLNAKGRVVSLMFSGAYSDNESRTFSMGDIYYFGTQSSDFVNQFNNTLSENWNYKVEVSYAEPFWKHWVAELRYAYSSRYNDSDRSLYDLKRLGGSWANPFIHPVLGTLPSTADSLAMAVDLRNSQYSTYRYDDHFAEFNLQYKTDDWKLNVRFVGNPQRTRMKYNRTESQLDTIVTRSVMQVSPDLSAVYHIEKDRTLSLNYKGFSTQPPLAQMMSVVNDADPLNISMGNPALKAAWTNQFNGGYQSYDAQREFGLGVNLNYMQRNNTVSNLLVYDQHRGVRYMRPENIDGNWNANVNVWLDYGFGKDKCCSLQAQTSLGGDKSRAYVSSFSQEEQTGEEKMGLVAGGGQLHDYDEIFRKAVVSRNTTRSFFWSENLMLNYRKNWLNFSLLGDLSFNHSRSSALQQSNMYTWNFGYGFRTDLNFDFGLSISTDLKVSSRRGYSSPGMNTDEWLWNAQISHSFLKQKTATVRLNFYDILHRQSNVSRWVNAMQRSDYWHNGIYSYCMLTLEYRLNIFPEGRGK